jgi:hypothetical protein
MSAFTKACISWTEALMNCLTSNASQTLIMLNEFSFFNRSRPSFRTPNFLNTGKELDMLV